MVVSLAVAIVMYALQVGEEGDLRSYFSLAAVSHVSGRLVFGGSWFVRFGVANFGFWCAAV